MHQYPDHRIIPEGTSPEARKRIAQIDEEFAQMREKLNPLLDRYSRLAVEREGLCNYRFPVISLEESEVLMVHAIEMLRVDPDGYLAPVVRALLAHNDSLAFHSVSESSEPYREMVAFYEQHHPEGINIPTIRDIPLDYADPRRR